MVQLQLPSGAGPAEICSMKVGDLGMTGDVWEYRLDSHKNAWRHKERVIYFGPRSQTQAKPKRKSKAAKRKEGKRRR